MVRVIERADTTTMMIEIPHHVIRSYDEYINVVTTAKELLVVSKYVGEDFQPHMTFLARNVFAGSLECFFYVTSMVHTVKPEPDDDDK